LPIADWRLKDLRHRINWQLAIGNWKSQDGNKETYTHIGGAALSNVSDA
jgi:hypothetical protein